MARPPEDVIETFIRITGAAESHAVRKLEEYGGNLDEAVNAHFNEVERPIANPVPGVSPQHDFVQTPSQMQASSRGILPLLSAARSFKPSSLLDPNYRRNLLNQVGASVFNNHGPLHSHTGEFNNAYSQPYHSAPRPAFGYADQNPLSHGHQFHGNVSRDHGTHLHGSDVEEQMIQLAIEASKREDSFDIPQRQLHMEDDELAHAMSLSLKTAEQENAIREQTVQYQKQVVALNSPGRSGKTTDARWQPGSSSYQGEADHLQGQSLELDEAALLEAAIFGETPGGHSFQHTPHPQHAPDKSRDLCPQQVPSRPSPSQSQQIREQQDDEYLASLLADIEKETNIVKESENKMLDGKVESVRSLAAKEASLPKEPGINDENAITLLVRMPDGTRRGRRFLKSDKLQFLFDFIDVGRTVKPGTYRVVRPYPRRAFCVGESSLSLNELGLTNKQEALYLELI
ncbi:plant UBX domain-containing protein 9 isoform X2 [Jatropha curcas]|uniref:plant UBX domain-containing protein 9 isoform X2 n=1 Tax=Jatropha curcas TaxID=180498 RepID=UPI0005FC367C|nr:plant UBX domain-containing protein 9 isoform X2 [Jatropha curcas]